MVKDNSDPWALIAELQRRVTRLENSSPLESAAVYGGRVRMMNGSELLVEGLLSVIGRLLLQGDMEVTGGGSITVGGVVITPLGGGQIRIGAGDAQIIIDGSTGRIIAGDLTIDPTEGGGAIVFANGAQIYSHASGNQIEMFSGGTHVTVREHTLSVSTPERGFLLVDESDPLTEPGIYVSGVPEGVGASYLGLDSGGRLVRLSGAGGGDPGDPPAGNPDGYVWPVDPAVYGISSSFTDHQNRTPPSQEPGVDVACPVGTAIWSPGPGTVTEVQTSSSGATGRYVTFVTDAGDWFRFLHNSSIVASPGQHVEQGTLLAYSGGSGFGSDAYYGPHSHISFKQGYTGSFPGSNLDDFEAYMAAA